MPEAKPLTVPNDGLTTRSRRTLPLVIVHTGEGKGKSTAAFGLALRAWNQGWPIGVFQFVKSGKWRTGERAAFAELDRLHRQSGVGGPIAWHMMGSGWSWIRHQDSALDRESAAREGWAQVQRDLAAERYKLYLLDEFSYALRWGWVDVEEVIATLAARPGKQHVIITGRYAPQALLDAADLVTEMTKHRHPMDRGQKGQRGIEW